MSYSPPPGLLTVRELRKALDAAHPDQVVSFSLSSDDIAAVRAAVPEGLRIVFTVKVDQVSPKGPVFRLTSGGQQPTG
jgi:hypothetical protein